MGPDTRVTTTEIRDGIRSLGLSGRSVCAHASLRSFGRVEGGAESIVEAFLAEGCTLLVPTFTYDFEIPPPDGTRLPRNGYDDEGPVPENASSVGIFRPTENELSRDEMGALPAAVLATAGRVRGCHPLASFSAVGPEAQRIIETQQPEDIYAPFRVLSESEGCVVLMGVGPTRMTLIHLAEHMAGRALFRRWARTTDGDPIMAQVGGCSEGFDKLAPVLAPLARTARVGHSAWTVYPVPEMLAAVATAIRARPTMTACDDAGCLRCRDAVAGGPILR